MRKRLISSLLALALLISLLPQLALPAAAADASGPDAAQTAFELVARTLSEKFADQVPRNVTNSGIVGDGLTWTFSGDSGLLTVSGSGAIPDWENEELPWYRFRERITTLEIFEGVTSIGMGAFSDLVYLTSVTIHEGVTRIAEGAFYGCQSLSNVTIPDSVTSIGWDAFTETAYYFDNDNWTDGLLYIGSWLIAADKDITTAQIRTGTIGIAPGVFEYCRNLTEVTIPDTVVSIGDDAFFECDALTKVSIPEGVTAIGEWTFGDCDALEEVTIPGTVTSIGESAFAYCGSLNGIEIPNSVTEIGNFAFDQCGSLTDISLPDSVTRIGQGAFNETGYCNDSANWSGRLLYLGKWLIGSTWDIETARIRTGTKGIAGGAFTDRGSLRSVTIPDSVTYIGAEAFWNCGNLQSAVIPSGITNIEYGTFSACGSLESVVIPDGVTKIGENAFCDCMNLPEINLPDSLTEIGIAAFAGCSGLTAVEIPAGVTDIGGDAFIFCSALTGITVDPANPAYSSADGMLFSKDGTVLLCCPGGKTGVCQVPAGTEKIEIDAFYSCYRLSGVSIPEGVTLIGDDAFRDCTNLKELMLPGSLKSIGSYAFENCESLRGVALPDGLESIGEYAFCTCRGLTDITIPAGVGEISRGAFSNCKALETLTIRSGVKTIRERAFDADEKLKQVVVPQSVSVIESNAFSRCQGLEVLAALDPRCDIDGAEATLGIPGTTVIRGYAGSAAEDYAGQNGFTFEAIDCENGVHAFEQTATTATCTQPGTVGFRCVLCGAEQTQDAEPLGHVLVRGICRRCGSDERIVLADGETATGTVETEGGNVYFRFTPAYTDEYVIESLGDQITSGSIYDENGLYITGAYGGSGGNFQIYLTLEAGTCYTVEGRFGGSTTTGDITVTVSHTHEHEYGGWTTVREPGCTEPGLEHRLCTVCGDEETQEIPATGHTYEYASGSLWNSVYRCRNCGALHGGAESVQTISAGERIETEIFPVSGEAWICFTPEEADGYALTAYESNYFCQLYDSDGNRLAQDYYSGPYGFRLYQYLNAGETYYYCVKKYNEPVRGVGSSYSTEAETVEVELTREEAAMSGTCGDSLSWSFDEQTGALTITGSGQMVRGDDGIPWRHLQAGIRSLSLPQGLENICDEAFYGCTLLTAAAIPDSVTRIGYSAFFGCESLQSVSIGSGVETIDSYAFENCRSLTGVSIPDGVTEIGGFAFSGCESLAYAQLGNGTEAINYSTFSGCSSLTQITIPDSVRYLGDSAFEGCESLARVTMGDSVTYIGNSAFAGCSSLEEIALPGSLETIEEAAFAGCTALTAVAIPAGVTYVSSSAFAACTNLRSLTVDPDNEYYCAVDNALLNKDQGILILCAGGKTGVYEVPDTVTCIYEYAFSGCDALTEIVIPASVTEIYGISPGECAALQAITVNPDNEIYCSIDGVLFNKSADTLMIYPDGRTGAYQVPDGTVTVSSSSFANCEGLSAVTFPESLQVIDAWAFEGCTGLTSVKIPENVTGVYYNAFSGCTGLRSVGVLNPDCGIDYYSEMTFGDPGTVTVYGYAGSTAQEYAERQGYAFREDGCEFGLHTYAFESDTATCTEAGVITSRCTACGAEKTEPSEALGHSLELGICARCGADARTGLTPGAEVPAEITEEGAYTYFRFTPETTDRYLFYSLGDLDTYGYVYEEGGNELTRDDDSGLNTNFMISPVLEEGETYTIGVRFYSSSQTGSFTVCADTAHDYEEMSGEYWNCEYRCRYCGDVIDADDVQALEPGVMTRATVPMTVGVDWFSYTPKQTGAYRLESFGQYNTSAALFDSETGWISENSFGGEDSNFLLNTYLEAGQTYYFAVWYTEENLGGSFDILLSPQEIPVSGECGDDLQWSYDPDKHVLTITGSGYMWDFEEPTSIPWFYQAGEITAVSLPDELVSIGTCAFSGCRHLEDVQIPDSVTYVGHSAFNGCSALAQIHIPAVLTGLEDDTFAGCTGLQTFTVDPDNTVYSSADGVLFNKDMTQLIRCPEGKAGAYQIPHGVTEIRPNAFQGCTRLTDVTFSETVTTIGSWAFQGCTGLTDMVLPAGVEYIYSRAFQDCTGLTMLTITNPDCYISTEYQTLGDPEVTTICGHDGSTAQDCAESGGYNFLVADCANGLHAYTAVESTVTCTEDGTVTYRCSVCGEEKTEAVAALGHDMHYGLCTRCGLDLRTPAVLDEQMTVSIETAGAYAYYSFTPEDTDTYVIQSTGSLDTYGFLYDENGNQLTLDDDSGTNYNFRMSQRLTAGTTYSVAVRFYSNTLTGSFQMTITRQHTFGEWTVTQEATCTEAGSRTRTCADCGQTETQEVAALGHSYGEWTRTLEPTCTEAGEQTRTCTRCGETETQAVAALGHDMPYGLCSRCGLDLRVPAALAEELAVSIETAGTSAYYTFTPEVTDTYTVSSSGSLDTFGSLYGGDGTQLKTDDDSGSNRNFQISWRMTAGEPYYIAARLLNSGSTGNFTVVIRQTHTFGEWTVTKEATCTEQGEETRTCEDCGAVETRATSMISHDYETSVTAPTCTERGYTTYTCRVCGYSRKSNYTAALGHTPGEWTTVREPTCSRPGQEEATCTVCGATVTRSIQTLEHTYVDTVVEPTYTSQGYTRHTCSVCGRYYNDNYVPALERTPLDQAELALEYTSAYYKGQALRPAVSITYQGESFDPSTELRVNYSNNNGPGTATVTVTGINRFEGTATLTFEISYESIPERIVNVRAVGDTDRITVSWAISSEVNTKIYRVYRKTAEDSAFTLVRTINGRNTLSWADTSVEPGVIYEYYVTGVGIYGEESEPSETVTVQAAPDTEAPVVTKVWPARGSRIGGVARLTAEASDNVGVVRVAYEASADGMSWSAAGESSADDFALDFDTTPYEDGALQIRATAYDAAGNASTPCTRNYTVDNTPPEKVTGLVADPVYASKLTLTWQDVPATDRTSFTVQISEGEEFRTLASVSTIGYNVSGLQPATQYSFRVACADACGNLGEWSDTVTVTTAADTAAPTVTKLSPAPSAVTGILHFEATAKDECGVSEIWIQASTDLTTWTTLYTKSYSEPQTSCTWGCEVDTGAYEEGYIYLRAVACDASGNTSPEDGSAPYNGYLIDRTPPEAPAGVTAEGKAGYITVSWTQGEENGLRYAVWRAAEEDGEYSRLASGLTAINYHDRNVETETTYWYRVSVTDSCGNVSQLSQPVSAQTSTDTEKPVINSFSETYNMCLSTAYPSVSVLATDNSRLSAMTVEYKVNDAADYTVLAEVDGISDYSKVLSVNVPVDGMSHGDTVTLRAWAVDAAGLRSDDLTAVYTVDREAPQIENLDAALAEDTVTLTWAGLGEGDASGYRVYRSTDGGSFRSLGSRSAGGNGTYTFIDQIPATATHTFTYKVTAVDRLGNSRAYTKDVTYTYERVNEPPVISVNLPPYMEVGVEQYFDATGSTDDSAIESWLWDFGDGTTSQLARAVKKYTAAGTYEVTLTLTDDDGESTSVTRSVEVRERTELGTLNVKVVDDNYNILPNVKVLVDRGTATQCTLTTDSRGIATVQLPGGEHEVAAYMDSSHLPAKKTVTVLENASRTVTLILVEEDLVTGEFEITRMDLDEIIAAGIDVYDPANQNIYQVQVRVVYGGSPLTIRYQRNDSRVLSYSITDSSGNPVSTVTNSGGEARKLTPTVISCGSGSTDIVAILDIPAQVSYLKEFFDVKLYITNNAAEDFVLTDNEVTLNVPEGMTLMKGLSGYESNSSVRIASIAGQETRMLNWCLRGDTEGDYELSADYVGTLDYFDEIVTATFTADEPIKVYGMNGVEVSVLACDVIRNGAFYFKIGLENKRPIDLYMPNIGLYGMVENVTEEVLHGNPSGNFYVQSYVLNTYVESASGARQYLPIRYDSNGEVIPQVSVLAPGQKLVYEYVCYNAIKDDTVGYFQSSMATVLSGYAENVVTGSYTRSEASLESYEEKLDRILSRNDEEINAAYDYIMSDANYYYVSAARDSSANTLARIYKLLDLGLDLDLEYFTMENQRDLAQQIILQILLDQDTIDAIDDQVMLKYLDAVTNSLSRVKEAFMAGYDVTSAEFDDLVKLGRDDFIDLTRTLATEGRDKFEEEVYELIVNRVTGYVMAGTAEAFYDALGLDDVVSFDGLVEAGDMMTDTILNGLNALDSTMESAYIYSTLYANASNEFSNYVLDAIISYCRQRTLDSINFESIMSMATFPESILSPNQIDRLAIAIAFTAKEDKLAIREDEEARRQIKILLAGQFVGEFAASTAASIAKDAIKEALGAPYVIAGILWKGVDAYFGFGSYVEQQDSMVVYDYMVSALTEPVLEYIAQNSRTEEYDLYTLSLLKALCRMRLDGEHHYRESVVMYVDKEAGKSITEEEAVALINEVMGTSYATLDDWYSELRYNINSARDILFNKEITSPVTVPDAPTVTLDYQHNRTNQSFSDAYEYCFADGEWITCDGGPISFTPKRTQTVMRVRVKATDASLAGKNKTVYIYASKELSKLITVRRDGQQYIIEQLKAGRTYQILFAQPTRDGASYDWSDAVTFTADADGKGTVTSAREADQVVIRSTISAADHETYSEPLVRTVSKRQPLPLQITGSGSVVQTRTDGRYFFGDTVSLTAVPNEGQTFEGWYADGAAVSEDPDYLFEMGSADSLEARFTGPQITELIISVLPDKLEYTHAETLALDGLVLAAAYSDGTTLDQTDYSAEIDTSDFDHPVIILRVGGMQTSIPITFEHDGEWVVQKEPTCTEAGYKSFTCTLCNETSTVELEALGHDWDEGTVTTEPTCTAEGAKLYTCSRCGQTRTEVLSALGHYLIEHEAQAPTCTQIGWNAYETCTRCDYTTYEELPALGHDLTAHEAKSPTCTEIGWNAYDTCSRCDYTTYAEIEALGHDLVHHNAKAATCTEIGWNAYDTCSRCDYTTYEEIPALGHDLVHHDAKAATCTEIGWNAYDTCSRCDYTTYEELPALGHDLTAHEAKAATCTEIGWNAYDTCSRCDYTTYAEIPALGHDLVHHDAKAATCTEIGWNAYDTCSRCDYTTYEELPALGHDLVHHDAKAPTCTEIGWNAYDTCSRCDYTTYAEIPALGHELTAHEAKAPMCTEIGWNAYDTCSRCDYTTYEELPALGHDLVHHDAKAATCTEIGWNAYDTCSRCDYTTYEELPALGHDLEHHDAKAPTCTEVGWNAYDTCSRCDYTTYEELPALGHDLTAHEAKTPTCTEAGWSAYETCSRCDYTTYAEIAALGHDWSEWTQTKAPTCTEAGEEIRSCGRCGLEETKTVEALGHDLTAHEGKAPTCTETGWSAYETCSRCDYTTYAELPALGHDLVHHEAKAATCTEPGWNAYDACSRCDYTTYKELPALGHDLTAHEAKAATCTEAGWNAYETCSRCDYTTYSEIAALGHDWSEWAQTKAPTCTEAGIEARKCSRCGLEETRTVEALGHDLTHHDAKAATCTEIGWNAYDTCSRCDYTTYAEIPALGHDLTHHNAKAATCTETGWNAYDTCSRCDYTTYEELPALGHDLVHHDAKAATCTEIGWNAYDTCSRCDYTTYAEIAALGHDWSEWTQTKAPTCTEAGIEARSCSRCGLEETRTAGALGHDLTAHEAKAATCTEIGWNAYETCSRCDYTTYAEIPALGHDLVHHDAKAATCTEIGWNAYDTCSRCDYTTYAEIPALGHDLVHHDAKAPTCTETGWNAYDTCSRCDYTTYAETAALGHEWGDWKMTTEPTCTEKGIEARTCARCSESETREADALGHSYENGVCTRCGEEDPDYKPPVDTSVLENAVAEAEKVDLTGYTEESAAALRTAIAGAKAVLADDTADQKAVDDALAAVNAAVEALEKRPADTSALENAVTEAEKLDLTGYTEASTAALRTAIAAAKAVLADGAADQKAVDDALAAVNAAVEALEKRPDDTFRFEDVQTEKAFYYEPVYWAVENKVTNGIDEDHFGPNEGCTRGQVVTFLWRAAGCPEPESEKTTFTDVKQTAFYYKAVLWAVENKITNGMTETTFAPDATCTRGQIVTFLWRAAGSPEPEKTDNPFSDVKAGAFYYKAVLWAVENGITKGVSDTLFAPDQTCTRGQVVTFLYRAVDEE